MARGGGGDDDDLDDYAGYAWFYSSFFSPAKTSTPSTPSASKEDGSPGEKNKKILFHFGPLVAGYLTMGAGMMLFDFSTAVTLTVAASTLTGAIAGSIYKEQGAALGALTGGLKGSIVGVIMGNITVVALNLPTNLAASAFSNVLPDLTTIEPVRDFLFSIKTRGVSLPRIHL